MKPHNICKHSEKPKFYMTHKRSKNNFIDDRFIVFEFRVDNVHTVRNQLYIDAL